MRPRAVYVPLYEVIYMSKRLIPLLIIFNVSGIIYVCLEILWRGYSHWTMYLCAGICGLIMAAINDNWFSFETDFRIQVLASAISCTIMEFFFGITFNGDFSIWDYRGVWGTLHILGDQVNILFIGMWVIISLFALPFLDWMEWKLGLEEKPYYRIGRRYVRPWEEKG